MNNIVIDFLDKARHCKTLLELSEVLQLTLSSIGFPVWAYQTYEEGFLSEDKPVIVHNYPEEWINYYMANNCLDIDPVVAATKKSITPFKWSDVTVTAPSNKEIEIYQNTARDFKMNEGVCIPIVGGNNRQSLLSISINENEADFQFITEKFRDSILAISFAFHSIAKDLLKDQGLEVKREDLTPREKECLLWTAKGKSCWEISVIMNISERTVLYHLANAKEKFGVTSKYHLMAIAISEGYISI